MKAILVIDMPSKCGLCKGEVYSACQFINDEKWNTKEIDRSTKPSWCPLKPMPQKLDANDWHRMFSGKFSEREAKGYGYNACIDEILGEEQ